MNKIEHIGIAVKNLDQASAVYERLLGCGSYKKERVDSENVITAFFQVGGNKIELLESTHATSAISSFIEKRGEGIHHIAFSVTNIELEMQRLKKEGFILLNDVPKRGADNKLVCFVHPKATHGVLIELCQDI